jgi:hypothetical protein
MSAIDHRPASHQDSRLRSNQKKEAPGCSAGDHLRRPRARPVKELDEEDATVVGPPPMLHWPGTVAYWPRGASALLMTGEVSLFPVRPTSCAVSFLEPAHTFSHTPPTASLSTARILLLGKTRPQRILGLRGGHLLHGPPPTPPVAAALLRPSLGR